MRFARLLSIKNIRRKPARAAALIVLSALISMGCCNPIRWYWRSRITQSRGIKNSGTKGFFPSVPPCFLAIHALISVPSLNVTVMPSLVVTVT